MEETSPEKTPTEATQPEKTPGDETPRTARLLRGWRLWLLIAVLAYTLIGFLLLPWIIEKQIVAFGETRLERPLTVERVRLNPYALSLRVDGLALSETDGTAIAALRQLYVNFEASSLLRRAWTFSDLSLSGPYLNFIRFEDGGDNLQRVAASLERTAEPAPEPVPAEDEDAGLPRLVLQHFLLEGGAVDVTDRSRPTNFATRVDPIEFELFDLSTLPDEQAGHSIRLVTETGAEIVWSGQLQPNPTRLTGRLEARGERPRLMWRYIQDDVDFEIADGQVTLALDLSVEPGERGLEIAVDNLSYTLTDLLLRPKGLEQDVLKVPKLALTGGRLRLPERSIHIDEVVVQGARLDVRRDEDGVINILDLLEAGDPAAPVSQPSREAATTVSGGADGGDAAAAGSGGDAPGADVEPAPAPPEDGSAATAPEAGFTFTLGSLAVSDFAASFEDRSFSRPLTTGLEGLTLEVTDFGTAPGTDFGVALRTGVSTGGTIAVEGTAAIEPMRAEMEVDVGSLAMDPLEPAMADQIRLRLLSGKLSVKGRVVHGPEQPLAFSGMAGIDDLVTEDTILDERFVAWRRLAMPSVELSLGQGSLAIEEVAFDAPYAKFTIAPDGTTNVSEIFATGAADPDAAAAPVPADEAPSAGAPEAPLAWAVGRITIEEGSANFADLSLPLPFATAIHSMQGEIGGVTSAADAVARVRIAGKVDESGSADIDGELRPTAPTEHLQMDVVFKNVHMPRLTPYSAKFAGRKIESGKLSLDLGYRIEQGRLDSTNNFVIEQIELGEKVDSSEAMSLPLDLAIALLKDGNGRIDIDLPVTGDLNDPEFHYGSVVWKAIGNLLLKAATAPFKLLGALIPGGGDGEQLEFIDFEPGSATLSAGETAQLDTIAEAIAKRPQLMLKVPSAYSATTDKEGLQRIKLAALVDARLPAVQADGGLDPERLALERLYADSFSQTELDNLRAANTRVPDGGQGEPVLDEAAFVVALRRRLLENQEVSTADLEALAEARAAAVTDYLVNTAGATPGQIGRNAVTTVEPTEAGAVRLQFEVDSGGASAAPGAGAEAPPAKG